MLFRVEAGVACVSHSDEGVVPGEQVGKTAVEDAPVSTVRGRFLTQHVLDLRVCS